MRILFVTSEPPVPPRNGVTRKSFQLLRALRKHAYVDLVTFADTAEAFSSLDVTVHAIARPKLTLARGSLRVPPHRPRSIQKLAELLRACEYDVVHLDTFLLGGLRRLLDSSVVSVWSVNDSRSNALTESLRVANSRSERWVRRAKGTYVRRKELAWGRGFDLIDVVVEEEASCLRDLGLRNVRVVPLGRPAMSSRRMFDLASADRPVRVGLMSGLSSDRSRAVESFLRRSWPEVIRATHAELMFVGRLSDHNSTLRDLVEEAERVHHIDYVQSLWEFHSNIDLLVVPIDTRTGTSNAAIEALAAGVPVVGMRQLLNLPFQWRSRAFQVAPSYEKLGQLVAKLARDARARLDMSAEALNMMRQWPTWDSVAKDYLAGVADAALGKAMKST